MTKNDCRQNNARGEGTDFKWGIANYISCQGAHVLPFWGGALTIRGGPRPPALLVTTGLIASM